MMKDVDIMTHVYQMVVLCAVIGLNVLTFVKTGQLNDILLGGLLGVMVGIPVAQKK
jgi:hypothetical protein